MLLIGACLPRRSQGSRRDGCMANQLGCGSTRSLGRDRDIRPVVLGGPSTRCQCSESASEATLKDLRCDVATREDCTRTTRLRMDTAWIASTRRMNQQCRSALTDRLHNGLEVSLVRSRKRRFTYFSMGLVVLEGRALS